jgi:hypothetical protein
MPDFSNNKFEITKLTKSIIKIKTFKGAELQLQDGKEMHRVMVELSKGEKFAVLMESTDYFSTSHKLRALIASKEFTATRYATAFVMKLLANRLMGTLFIKFHKPATPSKIFENEATAVEWLNEQGDIRFRKN